MFLSVPSGSPGELSVTNISPKKVKLSWKPVPTKQRNGDIIGYNVQVVIPKNPKPVRNIVTKSDATEVSELDPFTLYTFKINAMTKAGDGPQASILFKTSEDGEI